jgi:hypothetical protein
MPILKKLLGLIRCISDPEYALKKREEFTKRIIKEGRKRV